MSLDDPSATGDPAETESAGAADATSSAPQLFADRYSLGPRRGSSVDLAMFDAVDTTDQRAVVVKIVHPDIVAGEGFVDRFTTTMGAVAAVRHPNLSEVYDFGVAEWNGRTVCFVVGESLTGGSLRDLRDRGRELSLSQAVMVGLDVCRGLDIAHRAAQVHGNIRPSNLVFGDEGRLRVTDLGVASLIAAELAARPEGISAERTRYVSPEEAVGQPAGTKSDVYSLCLCLLEVVTGQVPFVGESAVATLANRVDKLMPVSADLGPLAAVFERAGRPDPADRSSVAEFGRAMVQAAEKLPRPAPLPLLSAGLFAEAAPAPMPAAPADEPVEGEAVEAEPVVAEVVVPIELPSGGESDAPEGDALAGDVADTPSSETIRGDDSPIPTLDVVAPEPIAEPSPVVEPTPLSASVGTPAALRRGVILGMAAVVVVAALGLAAWLVFGQTASHEVPRLAGLELGEARNLVSEFGWTITPVEEASDDVPVGVVVRSDPAEGADLDEGGTLTLVVSTGPALVELPELTGITIEAASALLSERGLVLQLGDQPYDDLFPIGTVISWTIADQPGLVAGATVLPGTTVLVTVSAGPSPRFVPDLIGVPLASASAAITELGLVAVQGADEFSSEVAVGEVMRQDPAPGTEVARGATVTIIVSKGPDLVAIPALADLNLQQVTAVLNGAGLALGQVKGDPAGVTVLAEVDGQALAAGVLLPRGTAVDVTFAVPAPPATATP
ncbi:MAG: PASTA domain-containing protein [Actinomycetota bacterium]|jgi:serine/threonine-protein kinase